MSAKIDTLPDWQLGYIAGIVDGEGSIGIGRYQSCYRTYLYVGMTSELCISTLRYITGVGGITHRVSRNVMHSDAYVWQVCAHKELHPLLQKILPYLLVKKGQAEIVVAFCERRACRTPYMTEDRDAVIEIKELNKKGPK